MPLPRACARTAEKFDTIILNDRWRVVDDPLQWILEVRKGQQTAKASGWRGRSFCRSRTSLLRCIRELSGEVDAAALRIIDELPDWYMERDETPQMLVAD